MKKKVPPLTEAEKRNIEYAQQMAIEGEVSLHPKYPTDRVMLDAFRFSVDKSMA